nr:hypothetical protein [Tanacetum cinerariifolium]
RSGLIYCSGGLSGKYIILAVCQIVHCTSGLSFLTAVCLIRQSDEFPLPEDFLTTSEERFPLLSQKDATTEEVRTADKDKESNLSGTSSGIRARITQSSALLTAVDEPASPLGDDSQGKACPTVSGLEAGQDMANIIKSSTLPHNSTPRVTSLAADESSMQQQLNELTDLYTRLQRQQTEIATKITAQDLEIASLKAKIKMLEEKDGGVTEPSGEDATIKGRSLETSEEAGVEKSTERGKVTTVSVPTGSGLVPTASPIFTTASVVTPYLRRKGK